jgi:uncharacterized repeat protein (TIGR01451 family)
LVISVIAAVCAVAAALMSASDSFAAEQQHARWSLSSSSQPTFLRPGGEGTILVQATNFGDAAVNASNAPVTITDTLPAGITPTAMSGIAGSNHSFSALGPVTCSLATVSCSWAGPAPLQPYETLSVTITVKVEAGVPAGAANEAAIAGGQSYLCNSVEGSGRFASDFCSPNEEAPTPGTGGFEGEFGAAISGLSGTHALPPGGGATPFGIEDYGLSFEDAEGEPATLAGSHPFQLTTTLALNQTALASKPPALPKAVSVNLPPGLVGNPTVLPQCTEAEFSTILAANANLCPTATAIGVAVVTTEFSSTSFFGNRPTTYSVPVFNLVPAAGEPARFGFEAASVPAVIDTAVRTGRDYGVVASIDNITQAAALVSSQVIIWGVPGDPRHDGSRGWDCISGGFFSGGSLPPCTPAGEIQPRPYITLPTSCTGPLETSANAASWAEPGRSVPPLMQETPQSLEGCAQLPFDMSAEVTPSVQGASTPTGLTVKVHIPQESSENPVGRSESSVKDATVVLPTDLQVNPAGANGLQACSTGQIGFENFNEGIAPDRLALFSPSPAECPAASKLGTVEVKTPLLAHPLTGAVYVAAQNANPFHSLLALYVVAEEPVSGVRVKLAAQVTPAPTTGQLTTTFESTPQLPFEDLLLHLFGGPLAALATPSSCGTYATNTTFVPWSGNPPATPSSTFPITSGANGRPCQNPQPFAPSLTAGSSNVQAGAFTPFAATFSREDGNQNLAGITLHMPPGLLGKLSSVTPCPEPQAAQGTCGPESLLGHTLASVGLGPTPYTAPEGRVFITQSYKGAPYGLSIAQPATAGPFDLGSGPCDCVVVRAKIEVDPHTSALTVVSDPLPTMLQGIPLQIKHVNVTVDRSGFTFNATNCKAHVIGGMLTSTGGASTLVSSNYEAANCATLPFKPKFSASTAGKASKAGGASLDVKVSAKGGPQPGGGEANIKSVKVDLPKQLPSRLTTLQKACTAKVFEANPASCPKESNVGMATAATPVLSHPLIGPAYLVSHGGVAFPDLEIVLQGEGITLILDGNTEIKKGITSSTFKAVPDAPISSFELKLPTGKFSILGANVPQKAKYNLCGQTLAMPTAITGQNGAVIKQSTKITVSGCPKHALHRNPRRFLRPKKRSQRKVGGSRH